MKKLKHKQEMIKYLKSIASSSNEIIDMLLAEEHLSYHQVELTANYIRLCTQNVQLHMKKFEECSCESEKSNTEC